VVGVGRDGKELLDLIGKTIFSLEKRLMVHAKPNYRLDTGAYATDTTFMTELYKQQWANL
jgi:hypothetical protein